MLFLLEMVVGGIVIRTSRRQNLLELIGRPLPAVLAQQEDRVTGRAAHHRPREAAVLEVRQDVPSGLIKVNRRLSPDRDLEPFIVGTEAFPFLSHDLRDLTLGYIEAVCLSQQVLDLGIGLPADDIQVRDIPPYVPSENDRGGGEGYGRTPTMARRAISPFNRMPDDNLLLRQRYVLFVIRPSFPFREGFAAGTLVDGMDFGLRDLPSSGKLSPIRLLGPWLAGY